MLFLISSTAINTHCLFAKTIFLLWEEYIFTDKKIDTMQKNLKIKISI